MRPKSPFLQNLRKKTPAPKMKNRGKSEETIIPNRTPEGFKPYMYDGRRNPNSGFESFSITPDPEPVSEENIEPPVDVELEKRTAYNAGYEKAKSEFIRYKKEAERLEAGFQELLQTIQESREMWVTEVREGVSEAMQVALHHIAQHESLQTAILAKKLSEAMSQLSDEKELSVLVSPKDVEFAQQYLMNRPGWTVSASSEVDGGAILESANGVWDARLQVTLDEIDALLSSWMVDSEAKR
jgi:flagellar biosynthesis/type III secretory pathway protein FliH